MKQPTLYIIQGFICAGKSTFCKQLTKNIDAICYNPDQWVEKVFDKKQIQENWDSCFDKTVEIIWQKIKQDLLSGKNVIFDMGFWKKADREKAREISKNCNAKCVHYYLFVPDEILKQRITKNRPENWAKIHLENFEKNKQKFEIPEKDEDVIVINNY